MVLRVTDDGHLPAHRPYRGSLGHRPGRVVRPLRVHVRPDRGDEPVGRVVVEDDHVIDVAERAEELDALRGGYQGTSRAFQPRHRRVRVEADEEHVAEPSGRTKVADGADVQEVEAAGREDDASALGPWPP